MSENAEAKAEAAAVAAEVKADAKAPRTTIELPDEPAAGAEGDASLSGAGDGEGTAKGGKKKRRSWRHVPGAASANAAREALVDADESFTRYAASHKNTVLCGLLGLVLALLILFLGFWSTLLIALFVLVGVLIGQALDGDNGIISFFRRYFGGR